MVFMRTITFGWYFSDELTVSSRAKCEKMEECQKAGGSCKSKCSSKVIMSADGQSLCSGKDCVCCEDRKKWLFMLTFRNI